MAKVAPFEAHHGRYERRFEEHRAAYASELLALRAWVPWGGHGLEIGAPPVALLINLLSGLTFLAGSLVAYGLSQQLDVSWLVPLAAGNFLYIGASDLVPEVNKPHSLGASLLHFVIFGAGLALLYMLAVVGGQ